MVYSINEGKWKANEGYETDVYTPTQISSLILKNLKIIPQMLKKL